MPICRRSDTDQVEMLPGLVRRTLVSGPTMMVCVFTFEQGVEIPSHTHVQEQVGYLVSGRLRMIIDGASYDLEPGDSYHIPANLPHSAFSITPSVAIDIFNPPREDYR